MPLWHLDPEKINIRLETCNAAARAPHIRAVPIYEETPIADLKTHQWDCSTFEGAGDDESDALNTLLLVLSYRVGNLTGTLQGRAEAMRQISGYANAG